MRYFAVIILLFVLAAGDATAQNRNRRQKQWPKTEGDLMQEVLRCLQTSDTAAYYDLFPPFDTLWSMVMRNPDKSPEAQRELSNLREHPQILVEFDPLYNRDIIGRFCTILSKGEDSGVQWKSILMARYVLNKQEPTQSLRGYDRIAPERFSGYMFVTDASTRVLFCIRVAEVQKIKGQFFGGQLLNILEAKTIEEYQRKEERERLYFEWVAAHPDSVLTDPAKVDSLAAVDTNAIVDPLVITRDDSKDEDDVRREVVDRKYYEGLLDNEIPIKLYIRYMKKAVGKADQFDGLYKLGENKRYLKLEIAKNSDGKWIIEDESATGAMELVLNGRSYTGTWVNADENGFDVVLTQTAAPKGKIEVLDKILDRGMSGRVDETQFETEEVTKAREEAERKKKEEEKKKKEEQKEKEKKKKKNKDREK